MLRLVEDDAETSLPYVGCCAQEGVTRDDQSMTAKRFSRSGTVKAKHRKAGQEFLRFASPIPDQRGRADDQRGPREHLDHREGLHCFSKAHLMASRAPSSLRALASIHSAPWT